MIERTILSGSVERLLLGGLRFASLWRYPLRWERLEVDDNRALWVESTPDYQPLPPLAGDTDADLAIIGGGFTGVSTAYHFSQRYPEKRVVLLEAKTLANGASGRNGGMLLNWVYGARYSEEAAVRRVYEVTSAGMDWIEQIVRRHNLPAACLSREGTVRAATSTQGAEALHAQVEMLQRLGIPIEYLDRAALRGRLALENVHGAAFDPGEGRLNGALFLRSLRPVLQQQGVQIYEQTPVLRIHETTPLITLDTPRGTVRARTIVLATDAYTGKLGYFRKEIFPLHGHVFATPPLSPQQRQQLGWGAVSGYQDDHMHVAYSSLAHDGAVVFGGGSRQSAEYLFNNRTAYPHALDGESRPVRGMRAAMARYLPASSALPVARAWSGPLGMSLNMSCSIGALPHDRRMLYAVGYSGHGVTLANIAGAVLTDLYSGDDQRWRDLPFYNARLLPLPLDPLRWLGFQLVNRFLS